MIGANPSERRRGRATAAREGGAQSTTTSLICITGLRLV